LLFQPGKPLNGNTAAPCSHVEQSRIVKQVVFVTIGKCGFKESIKKPPGPEIIEGVYDPISMVFRLTPGFIGSVAKEPSGFRSADGA